MAIAAMMVATIRAISQLVKIPVATTTAIAKTEPAPIITCRDDGAKNERGGAGGVNGDDAAKLGLY